MMKVIKSKVNMGALSREEVIENFDQLVGSDYNRLSRFFGEDNSVLLIVNDNNRSTPTSFFLSCLKSYLEENDNGFGFENENFDVLVATGSHSPPSDEDLEEIFGNHLEAIDPLIHRAKKDEHRFVGETDRGTDVLVDERLFDYDRVLTINSVEPHYFAGYTGGRKSFLPGICAWKTIEENHEFALIENSKALCLRDNSVHQDMLDGVELILDEFDGEVVSLNAVCDKEDIYSVCCGNFFKSFEELVDVADDVFTEEIDEKKDIVIAKVKNPLNRSLYQSLKGFENAKSATKFGGVLILVSKCWGGIGPIEFYKTISSKETPEEIIRDIESNYDLGDHKAKNLLEFLKNHKIFVVSKLEDDKIRNCFCEPFGSLNQALTAAKEETKPNPSKLVISDAGNFVVRINP